MNSNSVEQKHIEETAQLEYLRKIVLKTVPNGREPDLFTNATCLVRMCRLMNASDADIAADIERFFDKDTIKFAFAAADVLDAVPTDSCVALTRATQRSLHAR